MRVNRIRADAQYLGLHGRAGALHRPCPAVIGNEAATLRRDAGDCRNYHLMRDHHGDGTVRRRCFHPVQIGPKQADSLVTVNMAVEKGIQPVMGGEGTEAEFCCRLDTAAPATAQDHLYPDRLVSKILSDTARLFPTGLAQIALGAAVMNAEIGRVAEPRCEGVPQEQHIRVDLVDGIGEGARLRRQGE